MPGELGLDSGYIEIERIDFNGASLTGANTSVKSYISGLLDVATYQCHFLEINRHGKHTQFRGEGADDWQPFGLLDRPAWHIPIFRLECQ